MEPHNPAATGLLRDGRIEVTGRIVSASNATLLCTVTLDGLTGECVYKPVRGERPLWDFPHGTLAGREYASYLVAEAFVANGEQPVVPPTVLREGPFGPGMLQLWVDTDEERELVDVVSPSELPQGWLPVLRARDGDGAAAVLAHADQPDLRRMAALDVIINNADRKGGHVLPAVGGGVYGVDHGICLHEEDKLRTVLWGWTGDRMPGELVEALHALRRRLDSGLCGQLSEHITRRELRALSERLDELLARPTFPAPSGYGPAIPWPAF